MDGRAVGELTEKGSPAFDIPTLSQLLKTETGSTRGSVDRVAAHDRTAFPPTYRELNGIDFASSEINEPLVKQLHRCDFLYDADNIGLVGGPGTSKSHVATATGVQAIVHHQKRVRFLHCRARQHVGTGEAQGRSGQIANRTVHSGLVIFDELGRLSFSLHTTSAVERLSISQPITRRE